jgi:hypothetical protein
MNCASWLWMVGHVLGLVITIVSCFYIPGHEVAWIAVLLIVRVWDQFWNRLELRDVRRRLAKLEDYRP